MVSSPETVAATERTFTWDEVVYVNEPPVARDWADVTEVAEDEVAADAEVKVVVVLEVVRAVGVLMELTYVAT
jgi:hypothetical protein